MEGVLASSAAEFRAGGLQTAPAGSAAFAGRRVVGRIAGLLPALPYSADFVRQAMVPVGKHAVTRTESQRLLCLRGDDGAFVCRLADGWSTFPGSAKEIRVSLASRSIVRLNNVAVFRHSPVDPGLSTSMVGPNHYLGVLDSTHRYTLTLRRTARGMPYFVKESGQSEQSASQVPVPDPYRFSCDSALWLSGKLKNNKPVIDDQATLLRPEQSLTKDLGILLFETDDEVMSLPQFDARQYDLSPFGARLVKNDQPFRITDAAEDPMDVVTYHFGPDYAKTLVQQGAGLSLETHDFTQIMSPVTRDSGGFITLGRWERGNLELVGVRVPYGYSIIVSKGAVHGDATFSGSYLMAMTVNHHTMATADVVLLKNRSGKNIDVTLEGGPGEEDSLRQGALRFTDRDIKPLVVLAEGPLKQVFDNDIKEQKAPLDRAAKTGKSIVYYPFHSAYHQLVALSASGPS